MTAYAVGKAAKVTPPAVINQTSLPSQKGPMALTRMRFSVSFLATKWNRVPSPRSKPSSVR
jgi:hypothetical protein